MPKHLSIIALLLMLLVMPAAYSAVNGNDVGNSADIKMDNGSAQEKTSPEKYWQEHREGWFWYKDPAEKTEPIEKPKDIVQRLEMIQTTKELRKEVDKIRDRAVMQPSEENIRNYLYAQKFIMDKSTVFADVWRETVWKTPEVDYSLKRPVNATGIYVYNDERKASQSNYIQELANNGAGLFFIFSSTCPYCKQMAPTLKRFEQMYGMRVLPITMDGGTFKEFPDAKPDNGISKSLGVDTVPAVFLASPNDRKIAPIGYGVISISEIVERINVIMNGEPGESW
ncbi:MAG: conjugal transfer protein TraF [Sulfuricaulis sp.]